MTASAASGRAARARQPSSCAPSFASARTPSSRIDLWSAAARGHLPAAATAASAAE
jgi:hypothetical protein